MDTLTHALVGGVISDSYFRQRLGPLATPLALTAAALPDVDSFTYFVSATAAWTQHRGITHSLLPMLCAAPVIGLIGHTLSKRRGGFWQWTLLVLACLFSHTFLDLVTSWGTMPLLPFSNARISWDVAPVIDAFVFAAAGLSFLLNRALRWERVDTFLNPLMYPVVHRHPRRQKAADWAAKIAGALLIVYFALGVHQNRQTVRRAERELAAMGVEAVEVRAMPIAFTYIAYALAARDAEGTVYNAVFSTYAPEPMAFSRYRTAKGELVDRALATEDGRMFAWYTQGMLVAEETTDDEGTTVRLSDRRFFGLVEPDKARFDVAFRFAPDGTLAASEARQLGFEGTSIGEELQRWWNLTVRGRPMAEADTFSHQAGD